VAVAAVAAGVVTVEAGAETEDTDPDTAVEEEEGAGREMLEEEEEAAEEEEEGAGSEEEEDSGFGGTKAEVGGATRGKDGAVAVDTGTISEVEKASSDC